MRVCVRAGAGQELGAAADAVMGFLEAARRSLAAAYPPHPAAPHHPAALPAVVDGLSACIALLSGASRPRHAAAAAAPPAVRRGTAGCVRRGGSRAYSCCFTDGGGGAAPARGGAETVVELARGG